MAFKTDTTETNFDLIPEGNYEVIIKDVEERTLKSGSKKLNFSLVIRNDVEQKYQNRYLFLEVWKKHEPTEKDLQVEGYNFRQLMNIVKNVGGISDGTEFESVADLCKMLVGKCLLVEVHHERYNGRSSEKIDQLYGVDKTKFPDCKHVFKEKKIAENTEFAINSNINDFEEIIGTEKLPF